MRNIVANQLDLGHQISLGLHPTTDYVEKFGRNGEIDTNTVPEDIWSSGGLYPGFPTTADTIDIVSTDATDADTLAGAHEVTITGLDATWTPQTETVTLTGTTPATTAGTWVRANRMIIETAGTTGTNAGTITASATNTGATIFGTIPAGYGQTQIAAWTSPAGTTTILSGVNFEIARLSGASGSATAVIAIRPTGKAWRYARVYDATTNSPIDRSDVDALILPEKTDVVARILDVSDNDTTATAHLDLIIIPTNEID